MEILRSVSSSHPKSSFWGMLFWPKASMWIKARSRIPSSMQQVRSFHILASFYKRYVRDFSSIVAPMTKVLKGKPLSGMNKLNRPLKRLIGGSLVLPF